MSPVLFYLRNVISKQFCQTHYDSLLLYVTLLDELFSQIFIKHIGRYILGAVSIIKLNGLHMSNANCKVQSVFQNR